MPAPATVATAASLDVDYPTECPSWQHLKSMAIQLGHPLENPFGGLHPVYANNKTMRGLSLDHYETSAVFVFDLLDDNEGENTLVESNRKRIDVLQFDKFRFSTAGGWG